MEKFVVCCVVTLHMVLGSSARAQSALDQSRAWTAEQSLRDREWRMERQLNQQRWDAERRLQDLEFRQRMLEADYDGLEWQLMKRRNR